MGRSMSQNRGVCRRRDESFRRMAEGYFPGPVATSRHKQAKAEIRKSVRGADARRIQGGAITDREWMSGDGVQVSGWQEVQGKWDEMEERAQRAGTEGVNVW